MKKAIILSMITVVMILTALLVLTSCDKSNKDNNSTSLAYREAEDGYGYIVEGIGTCEEADIIIPSTYKGEPVVGIADYAFDSCTYITSVIIPDSVTEIGEGAFLNCYGLTSAIIGNGINSIGLSAFSGCSSLKTIIIPNSVTSIGSNAFRDCSSLANVVIGYGVIAIGNYAFSGCTSLTSVVFIDAWHWYMTSDAYYWEKKIGGIYMSVTDANQNAPHFTDYSSYYWYKK